MKKVHEPETVYYQNELEDEFSTASIKAKVIDDNYSYEGGWLRKVGRLFFYYLLAKPMAFIFLKLKYGHKIINRKLIKQVHNKGYFLYGNHTNAAADALIPTMINGLGSVFVIVHPNNVSMPVLGSITPSLGALPLPDSLGAMKNFNNAIKHKIQSKCCVTIYPEAHIWPYYTKIRAFKNASFSYPVQQNTPVLCFTNTYQRRRFRKTPRIVTYVDGPFYADTTLSTPKQREMLRSQVYNAMVERSKNSNIEIIRYIKAEQ